VEPTGGSAPGGGRSTADAPLDSLHCPLMPEVVRRMATVCHLPSPSLWATELYGWRARQCGRASSARGRYPKLDKRTLGGSHALGREVARPATLGSVASVPAASLHARAPDRPGSPRRSRLRDAAPHTTSRPIAPARRPRPPSPTRPLPDPRLWAPALTPDTPRRGARAARTLGRFRCPYVRTPRRKVLRRSPDPGSRVPPVDRLPVSKRGGWSAGEARGSVE
jgi:hypothetical protein